MRSRWWNRRAIGLHLTALVLIPTFLVLGNWQLHRALSGNELSWAYTFEWPIFAIYGTYMWWKVVHDIDPSSEAPDREQKVRSIRHSEKDRDAERELAGYNAYLAGLHQADEQNKDSDSSRQGE